MQCGFFMVCLKIRYTQSINFQKGKLGLTRLTSINHHIWGTLFSGKPIYLRVLNLFGQEKGSQPMSRCSCWQQSIQPRRMTIENPKLLD